MRYVINQQEHTTIIKTTLILRKKINKGKSQGTFLQLQNDFKNVHITKSIVHCC